ncbi:MAG: hypothetical protein D6776_09165 [Planctomycetota bacterium]|nr:MAG: hypothetical protein D6776_09165 [Planctomycetota bacterium]
MGPDSQPTTPVTCAARSRWPRLWSWAVACLLLSLAARANAAALFVEAGTSTTDSFVFNESAQAITYSPAVYAEANMNAPPYGPAPDVVHSALVSTTVYTGDFSLTFTHPGVDPALDQGLFGVGLVDAAGVHWVTSSLVEVADYPEYPGPLYRRDQGGYSYASAPAGPYTFSISRTAGAVSANVDGVFFSNPYTNTGSVRIGIYYYRSSNNVPHPVTISSPQFFANVAVPEPRAAAVLLAAGVLAAARKRSGC